MDDEALFHYGTYDHSQGVSGVGTCIGLIVFQHSLLLTTPLCSHDYLTRTVSCESRALSEGLCGISEEGSICYGRAGGGRH